MTKSLLKLFMQLDYRDKDKRSYKKVTGILIAYMFSSIGLSAGYFFSYDYMSFAYMAYSANIFLVIFLIFSDYANMFFAKENISGLLSYPLPYDEIKKTKFISAIIFIAGITLVSSVPQIVFFSFYDVPLQVIFLYPLVGMLFSLFISSLFLLVYSAAVKAASGKANIIVYVIQFIFFFFIFSSTRSNGKQVRGSVFDRGYTNYLPQKLFVQASGSAVILLIVCIITAVSVYLFYTYYKKQFFPILDKLYEIKPAKRKFTLFSSLSSAFSGYADMFLRSDIERASYSLTGKIIFSTKAMRMRFIPMIMMPLIVCIIGLFYEGNKYFLVENSLIPIINPSIAIMLVLVMRIFISNLKISEETSNDIEWLYKSLPIASPAEFYRGCVKYIYLNFLLPLVIVMAAIIAVKVNLVTIILNFLFIMIFMLLYNSVMRLFDREYPFTIDSGKINSMSRLGEILLVMIFSAVIFFVEYLTFDNYIYYFISIFVILIINVFFNKILEKKNGRTEGRLAGNKA